MPPRQRFPWLFPYVEEPVERAFPPDTTLILRPVVQVSVIGPMGGSEIRQAALVDSGADPCIAGPSIRMLAGAEPDPATEIRVGMGGRPRAVRFASVTLRIWPPPARNDEPLDYQMDMGFVDDWEPPWPVVLGQRGFFDHFTVTINRHAQAMAVEPLEVFDERFGEWMAPPAVPVRPPRFQP